MFGGDGAESEIWIVGKHESGTVRKRVRQVKRWRAVNAVEERAIAKQVVGYLKEDGKATVVAADFVGATDGGVVDQRREQGLLGDRIPGNAAGGRTGN